LTTFDSLDNQSPSISRDFDVENLTAIMAPKGGNMKKESGRAKKAENEANRRAAAAEAKVLTIFRDPCSLFSLSTESYAHTSLGTGGSR
jgi:hypothetical protein